MRHLLIRRLVLAVGGLFILATAAFAWIRNL
jgi:hypothetical protein